MKFSRKLNKSWIFVALVWGCVSLSESEAKVLDRVVAKVNSEIVTLSLLEEKVAYLREREGIGLDMSQKELFKTALNMMIDEKLQVQEGKRLKMVVEEESVLKAVDDIKAKNGLTDKDLDQMLEREHATVEQYKGRIRDQILVSKVVSFQLRNRIIISEKEIKEFYLSHQKEFSVSDMVRARHILFIFDPGTSEAQKRAKSKLAEQALANIRAGEDFVQAAKKYSEDVSASSGGDLGLLERGKLAPAFEQAAFKLQPGEVSDIVNTPYGLHIIKIEEFVPGKVKPYNEVKPEIDRILFSQKRGKEYKAWMDELRKAAFIEISLFENSQGKEDRPNGEDKNKIESDPAEKRTADRESGSGPVVPEKKTKPRKEISSQKYRREQPKPAQDVLARNPSPSQKKRPADSPPVMHEDDSQKADLDFETMEKKLIDYKELRERKVISEAEYQKRKRQLLNQL
ncbi:MAG: peptidylprolyl isomerase [Nitrospinae bacterium]|nr:peptidylprolyl isomerase [Nitrospinota bacterium]